MKLLYRLSGTLVLTGQCGCMVWMIRPVLLQASGFFMKLMYC
ncbi:hypothetical protein BACCOPRO_00310 [Phocaeicola coprophilus DSM 18228 = JCM 13818]|uniref:Uncharacterized protein n=1 Tax=Phocaeicola coprophilus DSM 18228 = JCM 13818 TaxID=547042 RepID=S0F5L0_9BACT|nr:hypothetical protein BACCOPRO_00310 [Phocaeicola coprophilus DSM 18228 = JCM 13818]